MPYMVVKRKKAKRPYAIVKKTTGKVVGTSKTRADAKASIRARYMSENN